MSVRLVALGVLVVFAVASSQASAAGDRTPPTKPGNLRVTAKTKTTISLGWNASSDNSGSVTYKVEMWKDGGHVTVATLPRSQTTYTQTGLVPNVTYYFHIEAVDPSGNRSVSDLAYATTDPDRTPPPAPANLRVTRVTASQVGLSWDAAPDDTGIRSYQVGVTGTSTWNLIWTGPTTVTVVGLAPGTAHAFTVKAQDLGYNFSPASAPASATTEATTDVTPPTAPQLLRVRDQYCGEVGVFWTAATDDQDPPEAIRYRLFINGVLDVDFGTPMGVTRTVTYGDDGENVFVLRAVDSAGNVSGPSNEVRITLDDCL
ncbi:MAG TPA: fibronectin type III domain-containing protein [Thermoleophilaceae bacterium]|jgi:chitodextrinase